MYIIIGLVFCTGIVFGRLAYKLDHPKAKKENNKEQNIKWYDKENITLNCPACRTDRLRKIKTVYRMIELNIQGISEKLQCEDCKYNYAPEILLSDIAVEIRNKLTANIAIKEAAKELYGYEVVEKQKDKAK